MTDDTQAPTAADLKAVQDGMHALAQSFTATAGADIALFVSIIGHIAAKSADGAATIASIGTIASTMLEPVLKSDSYPPSFKGIMTSRIESIIDSAQRNFTQ